VLRTFAELCTARVEEVTAAIRAHTGKATWDARGEADLLAAKVAITLEGDPPGGARVRDFEVGLGPTRAGLCTFRPHGVMAVVGPFNFPAHLPNGHIVPALLMGNTVVFKPSDRAPGAGQLLAALLDEAMRAHGAPPGVVNLVHGSAAAAVHLVGHEDIDGVLFTGSWAVGRRIMEANLDRPGRMLALEMGGNNAVVVMGDADLGQAVVECVRSAFMSAGQRCTCTRRVILQRSIAERAIAAISRAASALAVGEPSADPPVFMGPLISREARQAVLDFQAAAVGLGARAVVSAAAVERPGKGWFVSPGVLVVDRFVREDDRGGLRHAGADVEVFGPLLRVTVVDTLDEAIQQANATRFGLAASIFTRDSGAAERFRREARAGCVNVNAGTAGASSRLPFGGLGLSGNHRPAGLFAADYCAAPIASIVESGGAVTLSPGMAFDPAWVS
jgi:succinylglutamic semialdehyde dehydrogenase